MQQSFIIKTYTLSLVIGILTCNCQAGNITPIPRPDYPAIILTPTVEEENEGGFITKILYLRCKELQLEAEPPPDNWQFFKKQNTSLALKPKATDGVELTYCFYPKDSFINTLEPKQLKGYVENLKITIGKSENSSITLLNETQAFAPQKPVAKIKRPDGTYFEYKRTLGRYPLGQHYKVIEYKITSSNDQDIETTTHHMDYILIFNDYTFFAQFKAPPEFFRKLHSKVDLFIKSTQYSP